MQTIQRILITGSASSALIVLLLSSSVAPATAGSSTIDADADSYPDCYEQDMYKNDHDNDGIKDGDDTDDDNDGIADTEDSKPKDADNDGKSDQTENRNTLNSETDNDGDGYLDMVEKSEYQKNHDQDGKKDSDDSDDDNDGLADSGEASKMKRNHDNDKKDGQGYQDGKDPDNDNDGINDWDETKCGYIYDHDNDGIKDEKDIDDDDDGFAETDEDGTPTNGDALPHDHDNDGTPDAQDSDDDGDGTADSSDSAPNDADNDGVKDRDEEFDVTADRMYYGYAVYDSEDYDDNGETTLTSHAVVQGTIHFIDGGLWLTHFVVASSKSQTSSLERADKYSFTASGEATRESTEALNIGTVLESGQYWFTLTMPEVSFVETFTNYYGEEERVSLPGGAGGSGQPDPCEPPDLGDNAISEDCSNGPIKENGVMAGTELDQIYNGQQSEDGATQQTTWKLVPTVCAPYAKNCLVPTEAIPPDSAFEGTSN